jgi:cytochrome b6-f complex iron-sulfur subunit
MGAPERLARFVDALLHDRRPGRFPAEDDEGDLLLTAAALKSARPGVDLPSTEFVDELQRRLARNAGGGLPAVRLSRRQVLAVGGTAAAAAVAGVALDRTVLGRDPTPPVATKPGTLNLPHGEWSQVIAVSSVGPGQAVRFSAGAVEGFVVNRSGDIEALSAVCTHMGCILKFNQPAGSLDCPCHGASFALDGSPIKHGYLDSLTRLESRVTAGMVEVRIPSA